MKYNLRIILFTLGRLPPLLPELDLPFEFVLPRAGVLPRVLPDLLARRALVCWLVVCLLVVPALVSALWLFLGTVG